MSRMGIRRGRPHPWRRRLLLAGWLACVLVIALRAGQIQVVQAAEWRVIAEGQQVGDQPLPGPRGTIFDRNGQPLSVTRERVRVNVAPKEVRDADAVGKLLVETLGVGPTRARRLVSSGRWNVAGLHAPSVRDRLEGVPGIYLEPVFERFRPHRELAGGVLGAVIDDVGRGGIEQAYDEVLSGTPGLQIVARDNVGKPIPGERVTIEAPRSGGDVVLTIDTNLQEIAQAALLDAISEHEAFGGDVLITDPYTGEILALFSMRDGHVGALSALNAPFEPGSTLKPFTVAGLLANGLAEMGDTVDVGNGRWEVEGRVLSDTHTEGVLTLREALRESSNVGIAKLAQAMPPGLQYENLRDFGFGTRTGIELPGEVPGTLRRPDLWTPQSRASLAIGYEIAVTPLQMAMAYGALANGGVLMRPRLVSEVRRAEGSVTETYESEAVRRVVDKRTAAAVGRALEDVVRDGTGSLAQLGLFRVAGKSGTARFSSDGGYQKGEYSSSFVGYFPAERPQLVVFVKLDRPRSGSYYGGAVAAPVTRETMEAALAAAPRLLSLEALAAAQETPRRVPVEVTFAEAPPRPLPPLPEDLEGVARPADGTITVPDVSGRPARTAVRDLHRFGLRVADVGVGEVLRTIPAAGTRVAEGDTVRLRFQGQTRE
jgi:cell division protein FtsI (penicillin-binding protein 3)